MSSLLVFKGVYRLEIQSVMLVFSTQLCELLPPNLLSGYLTHPSPLPKSQSTVYTDSVWLGGGVVLSCVGDHILFNTLFLTRFRTHKNPCSGGCFRQINTCCKVPLHFCCQFF